jgi:DNA-binding PucR family transcriptional regulator
VRTLECYLTHAGDTQATARALHVHRTSLYHRLRRVEQLAMVDLSSGDERLVLHLGLKVARLQGLSWAAGADDRR